MHTIRRFTAAKKTPMDPAPYNKLLSPRLSKRHQYKHLSRSFLSRFVGFLSGLEETPCPAHSTFPRLLQGGFLFNIFVMTPRSWGWNNSSDLRYGKFAVHGL